MHFTLRNISSALALCCLALACTEDPEEEVFLEPQLDIRVTGPCAGAASAFSLANVVPVISTDDLTVENFNPTNSGQILVTGTDPNTGTRDLAVETETVVSFVGEDDGLIAGFASSAGLEPQSSPLTFAGRNARDLIFCFAPGTVTVRATIEAYESPVASTTSGGSEGGDGGIQTLTSREFKVSCVDATQFERQCGRNEEPTGGTQGDAGGAQSLGGSDGAGGAGGAGGSDSFDGPPNWSLSYVGGTDLVMGIRNSGLGRVDFLDLPFRLCDLRVGPSGGDGECKPAAGIAVNFTLPQDSPPNVEVAPGSGVTDEAGIVTARIIAGGTPGVFSVSANAIAPNTDTTLAARTPTIVIRGGIPSMRGFQLTCTPNVISGFYERIIEVDPTNPANPRDEYTFLTDGSNTISKSECTAKLSDRLTGRVDSETLVFFMSEAGTVDQAATVDASTGTASTVLTAGAPQPFDVEPLQYELDLDCPSTIEGRCGIYGTCDGADLTDTCKTIDEDPIAVNPRDGMVTIVAVTRGEELFYDVDGDRAYDPDVDLFLPEYDLPEPYVDANDNGDYDPDLVRAGRGFCPECPRGEEFRDTNDNNQWDPGNGRWDNDTDIWEESKVLWTGAVDLNRSRFEVVCDPLLGCSTEGPFPGSSCQSNSADYYLDHNGTISFKVRYGDRNGNCLDVANQGNVSVTTQGDAGALSLDGEENNPVDGKCWADRDIEQPRAELVTYGFRNRCTGDVETDDTICHDGAKVAEIKSQIEYQGLRPPLNREELIANWRYQSVCYGSPRPPPQQGPNDGGVPVPGNGFQP